ncbi:hypothetical protein AQF98_21295 [Pedobacter sp. Hv1]|nr:hypothetical protein AQF98_21295 [Pedobacter sp. Hv1]
MSGTFFGKWQNLQQVNCFTAFMLLHFYCFMLLKPYAFIPNCLFANLIFFFVEILFLLPALKLYGK